MPSSKPVPVHSQVLGILANSHGALGQNEEAIATYEKGPKLYGPDQFLAHIGLVATYAHIGRGKEARSEGAEVMRIDPNSHRNGS
jgi:tetratricopeptide (TPR) repeat protein